MIIHRVSVSRLFLIINNYFFPLHCRHRFTLLMEAHCILSDRETKCSFLIKRNFLPLKFLSLVIPTAIGSIKNSLQVRWTKDIGNTALRMYGGNKLSLVAVLTWTQDRRELLFYRPVTHLQRLLMTNWVSSDERQYSCRYRKRKSIVNV